MVDNVFRISPSSLAPELYVIIRILRLRELTAISLGYLIYINNTIRPKSKFTLN